MKCFVSPFLCLKKAALPQHSLYLSTLGYPDSNQERQDQNLQCYHYTIAQLRCKGIFCKLTK